MRRFLILPLVIAVSLPALAEKAPTIQWLWPHKNAGKAEKVYFRNEFTLPADAKSCSVTISADDWYKLSVNGEQVGIGSDWSSPSNYDLMPHLKKGANVIALEVRNAAGAAGLALRVRTVLKNGSTQDWVSDASWVCSKEAKKGWMTAPKAPADWKAPVILGKMGDKPWGNVISDQPVASDNFADVTKDFQVAKGFKLERIMGIPKKMGSWVAMTMDDQGRFYCANQGGAIYRVTIGDGDKPTVKVEPTKVPLTGAQGMLWHKGVLWVSLNESKTPGVWKVTDSDGDGEFDKPEYVLPVKGRGEHGPHALVPSPDGEWIYFVAGNHVDMADIEKSMVPKVWKEDHLLPRNPDARGHARTRMAPGGWIARFKPDGTDWEVVSTGYRNQYDVAFNEQGDLFAYDADMEWDMGMPWYRPTRVCHVVPGSEFGWRNGTGKWPEYFEDSLPGVIDLGPGSPTGVVSGKGAKFPAKYQKAIYCLDWTFATIYAIHMTPEGASYKAEREEFVAGKGFPLTDAQIGKDGRMYFLTGGRKAESAMWRVTYVGDESVKPVEFKNKDLGLMDVATAKKALSSEDRVERFSARVALESQASETFREILLSKAKAPSAWPVIQSAIGASRMGKAEDARVVLSVLSSLDWTELGEQQQLAWLRAVGLAYSRHGDQGEEIRAKVLGAIDSHYPAKSDNLNRELCRVLSYLQAPNVVSRTLTLMDSAGPTPTPDWLALAERNDRYGATVKGMIANLPPQQVIHYVYCLRVVKGPWKSDERERYFTWIAKLLENKGGNSYGGFLKMIREDAMKNATPEEREQIEKLKLVVPSNPFANLPPIKGPGRNWSVDDVVKLAEGKLDGRSHKNGEAMFRAGLCAACHRFGAEGGSVGPDLTNLAGRFSVRDLAVAIQDPSQTVSDQFEFDKITRADGSTLTGKVIEEKDEKWIVATNPYDMSQTIEIERGDIKSINPSPVSPMPGGLINRMNEDELKDLIAYLLGKTGEE